MASLKVQILETDAKVPSKAHEGDAGFDLYASETHIILPMEIEKISTGIAVAIEENHFGRVCGRSGFSSIGLVVHPGVIDSNYRGPIKIIVQNFTKSIRLVEKGTRIAQLLIIPCAPISSVHVCESLPDSCARNALGFGSSGNF